MKSKKSGSRKADIQNLKIFEQNQFFSVFYLVKKLSFKGGNFFISGYFQSFFWPWMGQLGHLLG